MEVPVRMSTDYASKEREFLDSLKADTGRDCGEWMVAIASAGLPHRNDIIDWLRQQGFPFSRASWLERIHHNGGRPIYADAAPRPTATRRPARTEPAGTGDGKRTAPPTAASASEADETSASAAAAKPQPVRATATGGATGTRAPAAGPGPAAGGPGTGGPAGRGQAVDAAQLAVILAPAKAYRPLAQYLVSAIQRAVPAMTLGVADGLLILSAPQPFAAILPGPRDVRLGLDLGDAALGAHVLNAPLPAAPSAFVHTVVLDDARQVNADLMAVVAAAQRRAAQG